MKIILFTETNKKINHYINEYNKKCSKKTFEVRTPHRKTIEELIRSYAAQLNLAFTYQAATIGAYPKELKPLNANNEQLATSCGCTARTIQNHIHRLKMAGIIKTKKFRGTNCDYELEFNQELLELNPSLFLSGNCKNFPLTENKKDLKNINNKDKVISNSCGSINEHLTKACTQFSLEKVINNGKQQEKEIEFAIASVSPAAHNGNAEKVNNRASFNEKQQKSNNFSEVYQEKIRKVEHGGLPDKIVNYYVEMLWVFMKNMLYANMDLTSNQIKIAYKYLYLYFMAAKTEKTLVNWYNNYSKRISKTAKYLERHKKNPYIPSNYLDPDNPNGFAGTKSWLEEDNIKDKIFKERSIKDLYVKKIINAYIRNYLHKGGDTQKVKKVDNLVMFTSCLKQIERSAHPELAEVFLNAVMEKGYIKEFTKNDINN